MKRKYTNNTYVFFLNVNEFGVNGVYSSTNHQPCLKFKTIFKYNHKLEQHSMSIYD